MSVESSWARLRLRLSEAQNHRCCYCGCHMDIEEHQQGWPMHPNLATIDHVVPRAYGGSDDPDNLVAACVTCNTLRGTLDARRFASAIGKPNGRYIIRHINRLRAKHHAVRMAR